MVIYLITIIELIWLECSQYSENIDFIFYGVSAQDNWKEAIFEPKTLLEYSVQPFKNRRFGRSSLLFRSID